MTDSLAFLFAKTFRRALEQDATFGQGPRGAVYTHPHGRKMVSSWYIEALGHRIAR